MKASPLNITILGTGAWGTALAGVEARNGHQVTLWGRDEEVLDSIRDNHENRKYLPEISLPKSINTSASLPDALIGADMVLIVTPAQSITSLAGSLSGMISAKTPLILCAKGIDRISGKLPAETLREALPESPVAALSGPSFAADVAKGLPTAVTLASDSEVLAARLAEVLSSPSFRVYASDDLKGVELGGALKNVIALAVGVCRGLELGASAEAALIARGFAELNRLAIGLGAKPQTLMGLSGLGDLVLTCSSPQSRNFAYGIALGKGANTEGLPLAEGALSAKIATALARQVSVDCPIMKTVVKLLDHEISAHAASLQLLTRPLKSERE